MGPGATAPGGGRGGGAPRLAAFDHPARAVLLLIAAGTVVRVAMGFAIGLGVDESYMVAAGRVLQLGYFDHPPMAWWLSSGFAHLVGSEAAGVVRLPFVALFALSTWLMFRLTAEVAGERAGVWACVAFNLAPVFGLTSGGWVLPDGPLVCALLAVALCLVRGLAGRGWGWWVGAGVAAGVALLSKYTAAVVLFGAFVGMASHPLWRRWLMRPEPWVALGVAAVVFAPVPLWNAANGWASFAFQSGRAAAAKWNWVGPLAMLGGSALFVLPGTWAGLIWGMAGALRRGPVGVGWLLAWMALPTLVLFTVTALWSRQILFHWPAPGLLLLFPLLGGIIVRLLDAWPVGMRRLIAASAVLVVGALPLVAAEVRLGVLPGDPARQGLDWTALRPALAARGLLGGVIAAPSWSDTGKVDYALGGDPVVLCLNTDARQYLFTQNPRDHLGQDMLIIAPRQTEARIRASYGAIFESIEALPPVLVDLPGRPGVPFPVFRARRLLAWPP